MRSIPLFATLSCLHILQSLPLTTTSSWENDGSSEISASLDLNIASLEKWQLTDGSVTISDPQDYSDVPVLVLEVPGNGTILKQAFLPNGDAIVRTMMTFLPNLDAGGDLSIRLNGVLLSFIDDGTSGLSIYYHDGVDWVECGFCGRQEWLQIELVQDYSQNQADMEMAGELLFEGVGFDEPEGEYYLSAKGSGQTGLKIRSMVVLAGESTELLTDSDQDDLPDFWEKQIVDFDAEDLITAISDVDPVADFDGDGISNADEFARGTSPTDYYNGQLPVLKKVSGDHQRSAPDSYVAEPLVVQVLDSSGEPMVNAPVTVEVIEGNAELSVYRSEQASTHQQVTIRTNAEGLAKYGNPLLQDPDAVLFYDDFDGDRLDREQWDISTVQIGRTEYGNEPQLRVTDEGTNVARLRLNTYNPENPEGEFLSGTSIRTYREFEQDQVIEFEARVRLVDTSENPISGGLVGAFSLYNDVTRDEVDWSYLSSQLDESEILTNIYNNGFPMSVGDVEYTKVEGLDISVFNTYTTRWFKDKIDYFVNGQLIRTGPNRGILNDVPEDPLRLYLSLFAPAAGFAKGYDEVLQPVGNASLNKSYFFDVDYVQVRKPQLETLRAAGTAAVYLRQGILGESTIQASAKSEQESVDVSFSALAEHNEPPSIRLRDTGDLVYGDQYIVSWDASDREGDAEISLYCDTDNADCDGDLVAENLEVTHTSHHVWKTSGIQEGNYHLYAVIDDGVNDPVAAYSEQSIYVPHPAYSENQLSNGGLEYGDGLGYRKIEGWESVGAVQHYSKQAYQGAFHARLSGESAYYQDVVTTAGQPWCALVYALNPSEEPLTGNASIQLSFYDKEGNNLANHPSETFGSDRPQDQYMPLTVDAVAPEGSVLARITLSLEGSGSVYFDEASLCKKVELSNSSFELGETVGSVDIDDWELFGETYLYEGSSHKGGWHIAAFGTFPENGRENYSGCYQQVPAQEGELWHASIHVFNPSEDPLQGDNEARLNLIFVDADGKTVPGGENVSESVFSDSVRDQHILVNVSAYAPPGTAYARIVPLLIQRENADGCICFDDARLHKEQGARNAGFELGDGYGSRLIWGWTPFGEGVYHDHTFPLDGYYHLRLTNEQGDAHTGVYQDFAVIAGEAWRAKLFAQVLPTDPLQGYVEAYLGFYYLDKNGEVVGGGELNSRKLDDSSPVGHYVPLAVAGIAPEGAVRLRLVPVIRGNGTGTVFLDRVSVEKVYKSRRDRDDDGLPDLWEKEIIDTSERDVLRLRSDIIATEDLDNDGLDNRGEFVWGTNPLVPDTDGDGVIDGLEIVNYSDPLDSEFILYSLDTDGDGISNHDEVSKYGTSPNLADTDGDGVSDWVEIFQSFTDALVDEFDEVSDLLIINGSDYIDSTGSWQNENGSVYARDQRGSLSYTLGIAEAGSYYLEIEGRQYNAYSAADHFELSVQVNGIALGAQTLVANYEQSGTVGFYLPHLDAGEHTITVQWINGETQTMLEISALRVQSISGPDEDANGIADWIDTRVSTMSDLNQGPVFSAVSPYTLEGTSYTLQQLSIQSDYVSSVDSAGVIIPRKGLVGKYYAHVDLNPAAETSIQVSDQGGIARFEKTITWTATNIMAQETKRIRKEDSLLLAAFLPDSAQGDTALIEIVTPEGSTEYFEITTDASVAYSFEQVGTYQLKALIQATESAMEVAVLDAELGANLIVYFGARDRNWSPLLPEKAVLEHDPHLSVNEVTIDGESRRFSLGAGSTQPSTIVARLGENGPIMDSTHVEAVVDYRNSNGTWSVTEVFADGSRLVEITIQLSDVPDDLRIELTSIKAGVTFDDGLIRRTVKAEDFNESGVYRYRMIIAPGVDGSSCHKVNFYQGDTWIGGNY